MKLTSGSGERTFNEVASRLNQENENLTLLSYSYCITGNSRWNCTSKDCKTVISIADETLLEHIAELLNSVIANPHIVTIPTEKKNEPSIELIRLNNEISRLFDSTEIDRETARAKILEYASAQYRETDSTMTIAHRLKDTFTEAIPLTAFCPYLFERTVDEIKLYADGEVGIILTNNQEIRNGGQYGTT